jgi:hypothetical protein
MMDRPGPVLGWGYCCWGLLLCCGCSPGPVLRGAPSTAEAHPSAACAPERVVPAGRDGKHGSKAAGAVLAEPRRLPSWLLALGPGRRSGQHHSPGGVLAGHEEPLPAARVVDCYPAPLDDEPAVSPDRSLRRAEIPEHLWPESVRGPRLESGAPRQATDGPSAAGLPALPATSGPPQPKKAARPLAAEGERDAAGPENGPPAAEGDELPSQAQRPAEPQSLPPAEPPQPLSAMGGECLDQPPEESQAVRVEPPLAAVPHEQLSPEPSEPLSMEHSEGEPISAAGGRAQRHPGMDVVADQALCRIRRGWSLASRGAVYSAREEFLAALRLLAEALDVQEGGRTHSQALAAGLKALEEAEDFVPRGTAVIDVPRVVRSHGTPVCKGQDVENLQPLAAMTRYHTYAQERLAEVAPGESAASWALFGLGKLYMVLAQQTPPIVAAEAKAMVYHQAALATCPDHALAANELAVLWARMGRYDTACALLQAAAEAAGRAEIWHNLALVQARLGRHDLARHAAAEASRLARKGTFPTAGPGAIDWVSPEVFAGTARPPTELQSLQPAQVQPAKSPKTPAWPSWGRATPKTNTR